MRRQLGWARALWLLVSSIPVCASHRVIETPGWSLARGFARYGFPKVASIDSSAAPLASSSRKSSAFYEHRREKLLRTTLPLSGRGSGGDNQGGGGGNSTSSGGEDTSNDDEDGNKSKGKRNVTAVSSTFLTYVDGKWHITSREAGDAGRSLLPAGGTALKGSEKATTALSIVPRRPKPQRTGLLRTLLILGKRIGSRVRESGTQLARRIERSRKARALSDSPPPSSRSIGELRNAVASESAKVPSRSIGGLKEAVTSKGGGGNDRRFDLEVGGKGRGT